ncbi:MAG TPA: DUF1697 domain-containing protein [Acidimicrobiia bacterium]|nr:DUF1697 domain-containing protein [Acidimicrobiia bacterium]
MASTQYVTLLRGINVGGRNKVPMAELRSAFEDAGYTDVRTYIQSGNVVFASNAPRRSLEVDIEKMLERHLGYPLVVVIRSHAQLRSVVANAPAEFGAKPGTYHSDAIFLRSPLTATRVMKMVKLREGVDQAWPGQGVVYFARLSAERTKSRMSSIVGTPEYANMTIRSWATTTKLLGLLDES